MIDRFARREAVKRAIEGVCRCTATHGAWDLEDVRARLIQVLQDFDLKVLRGPDVNQLGISFQAEGIGVIFVPRLVR